jgi:hypothetical protein
LKKLRADSNNISIFMQEYEGEVPSPRSNEVKAFCQDSCLISLRAKAAEGTALKAKAWLNDKEHPTHHSRHYNRRLTAYELYESLIQKV